MSKELEAAAKAILRDRSLTDHLPNEVSIHCPGCWSNRWASISPECPYCMLSTAIKEIEDEREQAPEESAKLCNTRAVLSEWSAALAAKDRAMDERVLAAMKQAREQALEEAIEVFLDYDYDEAIQRIRELQHAPSKK